MSDPSSATGAARYPDLDHFLSAYLHQDYLEVSGSFEGAVEEFKASEPAARVEGLRADIARFVAMHRDRPLAAYDRLFPMSFIIGDTDADALAWFAELDALLA